MFQRRDIVCCGTLAVLLLTAAQGAWAQEKKMNLFKIVTVKDEIVIGLTADELKALGGNDAGAIAHALAQKGDMTVWQYNVHRGANGELQQAPTAKIGLIAHSSLRVEPYVTPYVIVPHEYFVIAGPLVGSVGRPACRICGDRIAVLPGQGA